MTWRNWTNRKFATTKFLSGEKVLAIPFPKMKSENEVQAELWFELRKIGLDARLQVTHKFRPDGSMGSVVNRFDVVIFKNKKAVSIVEVKRGDKSPSVNRVQFRKYSHYKCKLFYCVGEKDIPIIVSSINDMFVKLK